MAHAGRGHPKYKAAYCKQVVDYMSEGLSFDSFAGEIGVTRMTLYRWIEKYPEFQDAKSLADMKCLQWWEKAGRSGMVGKIKGFSGVMWIFSMKARFGRIGWRDIPEDQPIKKEPDKAEAERQLEALKAMLRDTACQPMKQYSPESSPPQLASGLLGECSKPE